MEKLLSSDWLRQMQFSGNSVQKRVNSVQKRVNSVQRKKQIRHSNQMRALDVATKFENLKICERNNGRRFK